jgi:hypothetical protein
MTGITSAECRALSRSHRGLLDEMIRVEVLAASGRARGHLEDYGVRRDVEHVLAGKYQQEERRSAAALAPPPGSPMTSRDSRHSQPALLNRQ